MKIDLLTINELKNERIIKEKNRDYSLSGKTGYCFIRGNRIIKLYEFPKKYDVNYDMTKFKSERISFPLDYLYEEGRIIGEILPYYKALNIENIINLRSNIIQLASFFEEMCNEVKKFPNIAMYDIWLGNILYSNKKGMFLIDTTDWKISEKNCNEYNLKLLEESMIKLLKDLVIQSENFQKGSLLRYLFEYINNGNSLVDLLKEYREKVKNEYNCEIKSVSDVKKYMKIMKIS